MSTRMDREHPPKPGPIEAASTALLRVGTALRAKLGSPVRLHWAYGDKTGTIAGMRISTATFPWTSTFRPAGQSRGVDCAVRLDEGFVFDSDRMEGGAGNPWISALRRVLSELRAKDFVGHDLILRLDWTGMFVSRLDSVPLHAEAWDVPSDLRHPLDALLALCADRMQDGSSLFLSGGPEGESAHERLERALILEGVDGRAAACLASDAPVRIHRRGSVVVAIAEKRPAHLREWACRRARTSKPV